MNFNTWQKHNIPVRRKSWWNKYVILGKWRVLAHDPPGGYLRHYNWKPHFPYEQRKRWEQSVELLSRGVFL